MSKCSEIRERLFKYYGHKIICRIGTSKMVYNATQENYQKADIAVYIHLEYRIAVIWNLERRRVNNKEVKNLVALNSWENALPDRNLIRAYYKRMGPSANAPLEKVLLMDIDVLEEIMEDLYAYLQINKYDKEYPLNETPHEEDLFVENRERVSTSRWERDRNFRMKVLKAYGNRCAICRCEESTLLQAAHIVAVSDGGNDALENGICLCSNHHIMFDKKLLEIDFVNNELLSVNENVKKMAWYERFINKYNGKLVEKV